MDILAQVTRDRENLVGAVQRMQQEYEQLGARIQQQAGAIQYADMLIARVKENQNGVEEPAMSNEPPPANAEAGNLVAHLNPPRRRR